MNIINNTEREHTMNVEDLGNKGKVAMKDCWRRIGIGVRIRIRIRIVQILTLMTRDPMV